MEITGRVHPQPLLTNPTIKNAAKLFVPRFGTEGDKIVKSDYAFYRISPELAQQFHQIMPAKGWMGRKTLFYPRNSIGPKYWVMRWLEKPTTFIRSLKFNKNNSEKLQVLAGRDSAFLPTLQEEISSKLLSKLNSLKKFASCCAERHITLSDGKQFLPEVENALIESLHIGKSAKVKPLLNRFHDELKQYSQTHRNFISVQEGKLVISGIRPPKVSMNTTHGLPDSQSANKAETIQVQLLNDTVKPRIRQTFQLEDPVTGKPLLAEVDVDLDLITAKGDLQLLQKQKEGTEALTQALKPLYQESLLPAIQQVIKQLAEKDIRKEHLFQAEGYRMFRADFLGWTETGEWDKWGKSLTPKGPEQPVSVALNAKDTVTLKPSLKDVTIHFLDSNGEHYGVFFRNDKNLSEK